MGAGPGGEQGHGGQIPGEAQRSGLRPLLWVKAVGGRGGEGPGPGTPDLCPPPSCSSGHPTRRGGVLGCHAKGSPPGGSWGVPGPQHLRRPRPLPWPLSFNSDFAGPEGSGSEKGRVSAPAPPSSPAPTCLLFPVFLSQTQRHRVLCAPPGAERSLVFSHFTPFALPWVGPAAPCYR